MSGKLDRAIAEAETDGRSQELAAEVYVLRRRALVEQIPSAWGKFRAAIRAKCEAKPKHLRFMVCLDTEAKVERLGDKNHTTLELRLLRDSGVVEFESGNQSGCCTVCVNEHNLARICDQDGRPYASVDDAADDVLSLLFS